MKPQKLPSTYDLLKTMLVVVMIIDHIGFFFLPEYKELRAVGRLCAPGWFFLVGYAARRDGHDLVLWLAAALMILSQGVLLGTLWPLCILLNLALVRGAVAWGGTTMQRWPVLLLPLFILLVAANASLYNRIEYGTLALMFGIMGWLLRHASQPSHKTVALGWGVASAIFFIGQQITVFHFDIFNGVMMAAGVLAMFVALVRFTPQPTNAGFVSPLLRFCGRQTLLIYVVHYLTFTLIMRFFL